MMGHFSLIPNDDNCHSLLEPPTPAYSNVTVRRAFIVWLHCGQRNEFRHVCNYFHYLESLEDKLSAELRATSRLHEFNLLSNYPPASHYLIQHYPLLYKHSKNNKINVQKIDEIKLEDCVFNLEGFHDIKIQKGVTTKDILKASQMIRRYCRTHSKSLKKFLAEFLSFAKKTNALNSVNNISMYIKKKYLEDELATWNNLPKTFNFLDEDEGARTIDTSPVKLEVKKHITSPSFTADHVSNANKHANQIKILINESRRKELLTLIPNYSEMSIKDNGISANKNRLSTEVIKVHLDKSEDSFDIKTKI